jgi:hypothetical protein
LPLSRAPQLSLANRGHDFNLSKRTTRRPKGRKAEHWPHPTFHRSMILLDDIIEIPRLSNDNSCFVNSLRGLIAAVLPIGNQLNATTVHHHLRAWAVGQRFSRISKKEKTLQLSFEYCALLH